MLCQATGSVIVNIDVAVIAVLIVIVLVAVVAAVVMIAALATDVRCCCYLLFQMSASQSI